MSNELSINPSSDGATLEDELAASSPLYDLQKTVLSGIVCCAEDEVLLNQRMMAAMSNVADDFMSGSLYPMWLLLTRYYPRINGIPTSQAFDEIIESSRSLDFTAKVSLSTLYKEFLGLDVFDPDGHKTHMSGLFIAKLYMRLEKMRRARDQSAKDKRNRLALRALMRLSGS